MGTLIYKSLCTLVVGAVLMLVLSFTVYRKSYYYKKAKAEAVDVGERPGILSRLVTLLILFSMILFFALADLWMSFGASYTFWYLSALNLVLIALLSLFDALFIDLFLLVIWRPALLQLPEGQPTRDSMMRHIKLQLTAGWLFKVPIAFLGAAFSVVLGRGLGG
jgi:hypothetical protein